MTIRYNSPFLSTSMEVGNHCQELEFAQVWPYFERLDMTEVEHAMRIGQEQRWLWLRGVGSIATRDIGGRKLIDL